jgi:hypothetical protein
LRLHKGREPPACDLLGQDKPTHQQRPARNWEILAQASIHGLLLLLETPQQ